MNDTTLDRWRPPARQCPAALATGAVLVAVALSACTAVDERADAAPAAPHSDTAALNHVHGVAVDPADDSVYLAAHAGLYRLSADGDVRVGPEIDLMGFAVVGPGHFIASGHPGPATDLPQPVGLIESTDGGQTWQVLSRAGESDFHALASSSAGVLGFDGSLLSSADGSTWQRREILAPPASLAATADGTRVLATTDQGVLLSTDGGVSWSVAAGSPLLQLVDWAPDGRTAVGVDPAGIVWSSPDSGASWTEQGDLGAAPQAMDVSASPDGRSRLLVVTGAAVVESFDNGRTITELRSN